MIIREMGRPSFFPSTRVGRVILGRRKMTKQTNRVAIVTGASRGIGAAVAERLADDGFTVVVNYSGDAKTAEALARKIEDQGGRALTAKADDSDDALFDQHIAVNLKGTFNTLREAAKRLRDGGRIINFSTSVVGTKLETYGVYAATKSAIETMTAILSKEMRGRNITVNALAPGPTSTDLFLEGKSPELVERMAKMNPLERLGTPEDIAAVVAFLVGPDGAWINGQTLRANGGMV